MLFQCIIRLPPLYQFVMSPGFSATINKNNPHGSGGVIAREFATLIEMMCAASNSARDPRQLRKVVASKYKEFADNKQHDAQEMIGAILDGLHEDLNRYHYDSDNFSPSTDNNPTMATISNSNCDNMLNNSMNPNINNNMNNDLNNGLNSCVINGVNKCSNSTNSVMFGNMENMNKINENENQTMIRSRFSLTPRSRMYKSMNPTAPSSIIEELFFGHLETKTICPNCEEVETINDPFLFLSLPIPQNVVGEVPLESCVKKFICSGQLDENNKWRCPKCNINVCANQNMEIKFVSRILIIHLKRFVVLNGFSSKNDTKVVYPAKINISQIAPKCTGTYKLVSVVFHSGSLSQGHYTSAAVDPSTGKWYSFNDSYSKLASPNVIFSPRAYILFYMRVEK
ncbi:hypothetical protein TRFO_11530 [Tritrichomonas foetus]|uniref:ubiquitinyl hydrolase 1 n=1 Tax=Tritrichomonas foetus TaxID=1144522 RepID=A0A1J4J4X6_9EUKA|nr:hypothetical protein TRFO_11530 [Tritrichomonas foetus]|eukprot:OHS93753.1 hypothetical protein TRFO_11530 [Tritrichomonas foetus]